MQGDYKNLKVWQVSMDLAELIYGITNEFPNSEKFGLTSQMRRCAVSVPSNIAEGSGRGTTPQLIQFLNIAQGSSFELETQLLLSKRMNIVSSVEINAKFEKALELVSYVQKMNYKLKESLKK